MPVHQTLILSFLNFKKTPKDFLEIQVSNCFIRNKGSVNSWESTLILTFILTNMSINYVRRQTRNSMLQLELLSILWTSISEEFSRRLLYYHSCIVAQMLHSRKMEHRINRIHKRALRLIYEDSHDLTFQELLAKDKSVNVN